MTQWSWSFPPSSHHITGGSSLPLFLYWSGIEKPPSLALTATLVSPSGLVLLLDVLFNLLVNGQGQSITCKQLLEVNTNNDSLFSVEYLYVIWTGGMCSCIDSLFDQLIQLSPESVRSLITSEDLKTPTQQLCPG